MNLTKNQHFFISILSQLVRIFQFVFCFENNFGFQNLNSHKVFIVCILYMTIFKHYFNASSYSKNLVFYLTQKLLQIVTLRLYAKFEVQK